jgi:hypothetical protein
MEWTNWHEALVEWYWEGETQVFGENICQNDNFFTINPTQIELGMNPCLLNDRPAAEFV